MHYNEVKSESKNSCSLLRNFWSSLGLEFLISSSNVLVSILQTPVLSLSQKANCRRKVQLDAGEGCSTVCSDGSGGVRRFAL